LILRLPASESSGRRIAITIDIFLDSCMQCAPAHAHACHAWPIRVRVATRERVAIDVIFSSSRDAR
jgi:hypothetical protein